MKGSTVAVLAVAGAAVVYVVLRASGASKAATVASGTLPTSGGKTSREQLERSAINVGTKLLNAGIDRVFSSGSSTGGASRTPIVSTPVGAALDPTDPWAFSPGGAYEGYT